jgi:hypothetical protein
VYFRSMTANWRGRPSSTKVEPIGRDRRGLLIGPYTVNNSGYRARSSLGEEDVNMS